MDKLIGREKEITLLIEYTSSTRPEFVAIYGRRRVGKTFLVNHLFNGKMAFAMTGVLDGTSEEQMEAFVDALQEYSKKPVKRPENWMEAFRLLKDYLKRKVKLKQRCIVFLDELPSMDTQRSGFVRALGYFWNSWASMQDNLTLIVCGSATSWMIKNVVNDKGGLHDRITHELHLHPFTLHETEAYLKSRNFKWERLSVLQAYMVLGGVPYYLSLLHHNESFATNIDRLFFGEEEELRREYKRLYSTLFKSPESYMAIVSALSKVKQGMTRKELTMALGKESSGGLSQKLEDLVNCDIIRKYVIREKRISKRSAIYQLTDFYSQFYLTFVPRAEAETNYWSNHVGTPEINTWLGLCFERVCMTHVSKIKEAGFKVAIDDFGKGYSSLNLVSRNTFDVIKIDQSFINRDHKNNSNDIVLKTILELTKELNLETVAEGVENKEQLDFLKNAGCDVIQGFYFAKPMPIYEFERLLKKK